MSIQGKKHELRNTILDQDDWLETFFNKSTAAAIFGVVLPIVGLIERPFQILALEGGMLIAYQAFLILSTIIMIGWLISDLQDEI